MQTKSFTFNDVLNRRDAITFAGAHLSGRSLYSHARFARMAREHQAQFREEVLNVPQGRYPHTLTEDDARKGLTFYEDFRDEILDELHQTDKPMGKATPSNPMANLARSEYIRYNIFLPMRRQPEACRKLLNLLLDEEEIKSVRSITFEYRPSPRKRYLDDRTRFEVYILCTDMENRPCAFGIEVVYAEAETILIDGTREAGRVREAGDRPMPSDRYAQVTAACNFYKDGVGLEELSSNRFRHLWRNHILGGAMVLNGDLSSFWSVTLYPRQNVHYSRDTMPAYKRLLRPSAWKSCIPVTYERFFGLLRRCFTFTGVCAWVNYLQGRYLFEAIG